ncbi:Sulfotransferase domain protein [Gammaproteobacteria bacterium MOLA455]|nr:Sulfotransferase domain protein [Gammaproteobacteria bacterium MOLA455]
MHPLLLSSRSIRESVSMGPPVIVVGLPRSGTSFVSDILSQIPELYVFDDLYLYREAKAIGADNGYLNASQLDKLLFFLGWQIRARIRHGTFSIPDMKMEDVDQVMAALYELYKEADVTWFQLLEEWMMRLAINQGASHWGYKAPQDFLHTAMLSRVFPGVKFIFVQRDPRDMMRSLKYVHSKDGNPKQYHPVAYSLYWKSCAAKIRDFQSQGYDSLVLKFDDLVKSPSDSAAEVARYLGLSVPTKMLVKEKNSSFKNKKEQNLTSTETWIIEKIIGSDLQLCGFQASGSKPSFFGIFEVIRVSVVFIIYQAGRVVKKRSALVSIKSFIYSIFTGKNT